MEFRGENFMKNIEVQQEIDELNAQEEAIELQKKKLEKQILYTKDSDFQQQMNLEEEKPDELMNISLNAEDEKQKDKKKYLILGLALAVLFIITIIVMRFLSNVDEGEKQLSTIATNISQDKVLQEIDTEQEYQKIINQKVKNLKDEKKKVSVDAVKKEPSDTFDIDKVEKNEKPLPAGKKVILKKEETYPEGDIFELEKKKVQKVVRQKAPKTTKVPQKKQKISAPEVVDFTKSVAVKSSGKFFIQIGAFSKSPSKKYLANITKKGYSYKVHKITIKNKIYNKILVGPYKTRKVAELNLAKTRKNLKNPKAYVLKLK